MAEIYPSTLPCATWQYSEAVNLFPERVEFDSGWARQRREWDSVGRTLQLTFTMNAKDFDRWNQWVALYGHDWYLIDLDDYGAGQVNTEVRNISAASWRYTSHDRIDVQVQAEVKTVA